MQIVREKSGSAIAEDFRNAGGTPIVIDTANRIAYAIDSAGSIFQLGETGMISAINLSAGTTSNNLSKVTFSNANGVTFGLNGSVVTASVAAGGEPNFSAGTTSNNLGSVVFSNSHGISFGLDGSTITASYNPPSGRSIQFSAGTKSESLSAVEFIDSNGVSFGLNAGTITATVATNYLTTAMLSNASTAFAGIGETTTTQAGTALGLTVDTAGVNIAYPAWLTTAQPPGAYLTTARASNDGVGLNTALTAGPLAWTVNSGGISLNAGSAAGTSTGFTGGASISGSMTHNTGGLAVSLSHPAWLTTAALSNHSHGNPQLNLTNLSGTTASNSAGFTLSLSAAAPGAGGGAAISAGANSQNTGTVNFANSNRVTFGLSNNGTMTASIDAAGTGTTFAGANLSGSMTLNSAGLNLSMSAAAPGGGADKSASWHRINEFVTTAALWNNATFSNRPMFVPFKMQEAITAVKSVDIYVSRTGGTSALASLHLGIYTLANATSMNLISSTSFAVSLTTSAQFSGIRRLQFTGLDALSLAPGQYVMGLLASQAGTASWGMNAMGIGSAAIVGVIHPGTNSTEATATNTLAAPFMGVWNANSAALPSAVAASSVRGGLGGNNALVYAIIKAIT